jgi:hypothetical protein
MPLKARVGIAHMFASECTVPADAGYAMVVTKRVCRRALQAREADNHA